jgi:short-subunit dehydrogenase
MALPPPAETSTALITGASSGIGAAIARELAGRGYGATLVARREERLRELADELAGQFDVRMETIAADLTSEKGREGVATRLSELSLDVEILINNAGFGGFGAVHEMERSHQVEMVRLNCETLVYFQATYTPAMAGRGRGAVLNVGSTASFQPLPGSATYAATKAFVLSLSEASHAELAPSGVTVTTLCPGPVKTEFGELAGAGGVEDKLPKPFWTSREDVAKQAVDALAKGKRVVVPGVLNRAGALGGQHVPRSLMLPVVRRAYRRVF